MVSSCCVVLMCDLSAILHLNQCRVPALQQKLAGKDDAKVEIMVSC